MGLTIERTSDGSMRVVEDDSRFRRAEATAAEDAHCCRCGERIGREPFHEVNDNRMHARCVPRAL